MLKIEDVMVTPVITAEAEMTIKKAVERMNQHEIGCLVVMKKGEFVGMLTERDVLKRVVAETRNPEETLVKDVMSKSLVVADPKTSLEEATFLMLERRVKKLPVVEDKKLVGLVTITDIARIARAKGLERLEHADVQVGLKLRKSKVKVGEDINLVIELANSGKGPALLMKIESVVPEGVRMIKKPTAYNIEEADLNMRGRRLPPFSTDEIRLTCRSQLKGTFTINPELVYLDETGKYKRQRSEPATVEVLEVVLPSRVTTGYDQLDNLLFGGIPKSYTIILTSPSCDETDMLIRRFLETGRTENEITFYITTKLNKVKALAESTGEDQSNLYIFLCNPKADSIETHQPNMFSLKGVENLTDISISLALAFRSLEKSRSKSRRACIEIISDVLLQHRAALSRRWLSGVIPELKLQGFTTLAVMDPGMHPPQEVRAVLDLFEGEINVYDKETERGTEKFMKISRLYNQKYLDSELRLR